MSAMTDAGRRGLAVIDRLLDALVDPARRERTVVAVLLAYAGLWTLYAAIAKGSQDIHADMSEQFVLARELALGYPKHPPLAMMVVRAWFTVFPTADWAYYLLAMANVALTLWITWRLAARFLDAEKRVVGLALLTLVPFFNFHALKFNVNTVLMPVWAATTLWFLRSFETRRPLDAALAGLGAAAAMYGKYWSVFLLLGLGVAALADPRRAAYFRSPAPWITTAVGALALAPHGLWLIRNDFGPFSYAVVVHGAASLASTVGSVLGYVAGSVAYIAVPLLIVLVAARPSAAAVRDMAWPRSPERRLAAAAFWAVLLAPALVAPFAGVRLVSLWSMSAWTLLPVMLLSSPLVVISRRDAAGIVTLAV
ncbi:MAG: glycosyltransferase family 39 protein, partial [Xanthobacteraceae bacterium]